MKLGELCLRYVTSGHGQQAKLFLELVLVARVGDSLEAAGFQRVGPGVGKKHPRALHLQRQSCVLALRQ